MTRTDHTERTNRDDKSVNTEHLFSKSTSLFYNYIYL
jgi:hypothetical protein